MKFLNGWIDIPDEDLEKTPMKKLEFVSIAKQTQVNVGNGKNVVIMVL